MSPLAPLDPFVGADITYKVTLLRMAPMGLSYLSDKTMVGGAIGDYSNLLWPFTKNFSSVEMKKYI